MNNGKPSKTDIENDFVQILEKYPKSIEKPVSICFDLILDCFVVILVEKKTIKLLEQAKRAVRGGNHTQKPTKARKTRKKAPK